MIVGFDAHKGYLVVSGVIVLVVCVLDAGEAAKERTVRVLYRLTENSNNV